MSSGDRAAEISFDDFLKVDIRVGEIDGDIAIVSLVVDHSLRVENIQRRPALHVPGARELHRAARRAGRGPRAASPARTPARGGSGPPRTP